MTRIGIVGVGFMGMIHFLAAKRVEDARVVAIATRDPKKRAGDWTSIQGNFGPRGGMEDLTGISAYRTPEELLADPEVDLVDVCLPNDLHEAIAIQAFESGKDVLVEKPIALELDAADRMVAAAERTGRVLLVAQVLPFFPDFAYALAAIRSGSHGSLQAAHFRRHISPPDWSADMADVVRTGGPIIDLHIHDAHFVRVACGMPTAVHSRGIVHHSGPSVVTFVDTHYHFEDGPIVSASSGAISQPSRPFTHGFELFFERATMSYEAGGPLVVFGPEGRTEPALGSGDPVDAFVRELETAVASISKGEADDSLSGSLARDALALCLAERESIRTGNVVSVQ